MPKKNIHPKFVKVNIFCTTCNNEFKSMSTKKEDFKVDICSVCHPFYTGKQTFIKRGRVEKFIQKVEKQKSFIK